MRIYYLAGAGSVHTQRWVKYFADNGHEVRLISSSSFDGNNVENVKLHLLKKSFQIRIIYSPVNLLITIIRVKKLLRPIYSPICSLASLLITAIQVRRLLRKEKPDILHAHFVEGNGVIGALSGFHPFILTAWGSDVLTVPRKSRLSRRMVKYALKMADLITCDAEHVKRALIELGAKPQKINLINFGVDTQRFSPRQRGENIREELGIFDSPMVISLRALEPLYDIDSLIASIPLVLKEIPEARFLIAGKGSQERKLKELAESLGVSDSIRFVGWIPNDELPQYLTSADIYVSTSLSDAGLAAGTAEAMACGLPVIITDFGDNRKWVQDGVNGYIIPLRSPEALASKIICLIRNKDIGQEFGQINRQIIEERNNWEREMGKVEKLYEELIVGGKK